MSSSESWLSASLITTKLMVISTVFPALSGGAVYMRYRARLVSRQDAHPSDWWIFIAWVATLLLSVIIWVFASLIGIDHYNVDFATGIKRSLICLYSISAWLQIPLFSVKVAILLFYKRIFGLSQTFRIAVWAAISLVVCWAIIFTCLTLFQSDPIAGAWEGNGRFRFAMDKVGFAQCGTSIGLDLVVLCFPLPVISALHLKLQRKIAIGLIFWLGSFCVVASIVRLVLLHQAIYKVLETGGLAISVQWKNTIFLLLEANCSVIAGCLPCFGPLLRGGRAPESLLRSVRSIFSLRSRSSSSDRSNYVEFGHDNAGPANETPIELKNALRSYSHGYSTVDVERVSQREEAEQEDGIPSGRINITKGVDVRRS